MASFAPDKKFKLAQAGTAAKLNGLDPESYLREVIGRIADHPINRIAALLPWNIGLGSPILRSGREQEVSRGKNPDHGTSPLGGDPISSLVAFAP